MNNTIFKTYQPSSMCTNKCNILEIILQDIKSLSGIASMIADVFEKWHMRYNMRESETNRNVGYYTAPRAAFPPWGTDALEENEEQ